MLHLVHHTFKDEPISGISFSMRLRQQVMLYWLQCIRWNCLKLTGTAAEWPDYTEFNQSFHFHGWPSSWVWYSPDHYLGNLYGLQQIKAALISHYQSWWLYPMIMLWHFMFAGNCAYFGSMTGNACICVILVWLCHMRGSVLHSGNATLSGFLCYMLIWPRNGCMLYLETKHECIGTPIDIYFHIS